MSKREVLAVLLFILGLGGGLLWRWHEGQERGTGITVSNGEGYMICVTPDGREVREGDQWLASDGTMSVCAATGTWTIVPECSDGKRVTPEGRIAACGEPKP